MTKNTFPVSSKIANLSRICVHSAFFPKNRWCNVIFDKSVFHHVYQKPTKVSPIFQTSPFGLNHRFSRKSRFRSPILFLQPCRIIIRFIHKAPSSDLRACNMRRVIWLERRSGTLSRSKY